MRMTNTIHPSAIIGVNVRLGTDNVIGPNVVIGDGVKLGDRNRILHGAFLGKGTELGDENEIHMNAVIGHAPQDLAYRGEETFTRIGSRNVIREFVTIHRGTRAGTSTVIGDQNFIMAYCHIAHNCVLANQIIMVNQASLTGHCIVEDRAFLSGMTGFHQFSRIGKLAMVSALSAFNKDIPPFVICGGRPGVAQGINVVGMRRAGIGPKTRAEIKEAYRLLYRSGLNTTQAICAIKKSLQSPEINHFVKFIEESKRGIIDGSGAVSDTIAHRKNQAADSVEAEGSSGVL
ncbi:MAG: Acyl-(acyl-carrier-protein)--UDP-N-acetylglucosamine O-acyltransferase [Candidatus Omnitrophica bacterium ADurb.Bin277]|nr:MAG: Acyl-(acyl-carrier-protein)--UDP-N-acetylglucosamine O-acyltransferase [Candidatus Omnitrophica bacterium ADurb.Bin277]